MTPEAARARLAEVREELAALIADVDGALPPSAPLRSDMSDGGLAMRVWYDDHVLTVHTCPDLPDDGQGPHPPAVYLMAGRQMQWAPDWASLSPTEARRLGLALLSATKDPSAAHLDDELAARRADSPPKGRP